MAYHPQRYGKTKSVNQVLEYMLIMYVMDKPSKWEDCLHMVDFTYNNGNQASLVMNPFGTLYGKGCRILVNWDSTLR